jgi:hypothetical protein
MMIERILDANPACEKDAEVSLKATPKYRSSGAALVAQFLPRLPRWAHAIPLA